MLETAVLRDATDADAPHLAAARDMTLLSVDSMPSITKKAET